MPVTDSHLNLAGKRRIGIAAENQPKTVCALLDFASSRNESVAGPSLGWTIFSAGIQTEKRTRRIRLMLGFQPKLLCHGFHFCGHHVQLWWHWRGVSAQRSNEVKVLANLMRGT